jgi:hypothetical protein
MAATRDLHVRVKPEIEWPRFEYATATRLDKVNGMAKEGWRAVSVAVSEAGVLYLMERPAP